jgi:hypothetical protein
MISLCAPTPEITCFGCCPPIRPAHYDPLKYAGSLRREFAENRQRFLREGPAHRPIIGYSCWALGFLDAHGSKVGCMLHPEQNAGKDLRGLIGYGNKCRRESCPPAQVFSQMSAEAQEFWVTLAKGLNSFHYSSPGANPLFHILHWGKELLELMRIQAVANGWSITELLYHHGFLLSLQWRPKAHQYLFRTMITRGFEAYGSGEQLECYCIQVLKKISALPEIANAVPTSSLTLFTHHLPMDRGFVDFLRIGLKITRTTTQRACKILRAVERAIEDTQLAKVSC